MKGTTEMCESFGCLRKELDRTRIALAETERMWREEKKRADLLQAENNRLALLWEDQHADGQGINLR
jgi:hypothetical protein